MEKPSREGVALTWLSNPVVMWAGIVLIVLLLVRFIVPGLLGGIWENIKKGANGVIDGFFGSVSTILGRPTTDIPPNTSIGGAPPVNRSWWDQVRGAVATGDRQLADWIGVLALLLLTSPAMAEVCYTETFTPTVTPTRTVTRTITASITRTWTRSRTITKTFSHTPTTTPTRSITKTRTITATWSTSPTRTVTRTRTATRTITVTSTPTPTASPTWTFTSTRTTILTSTPTMTATRTATRTITATSTPTPTATPTPETIVEYLFENNLFDTGPNALTCTADGAVTYSTTTGLCDGTYTVNLDAAPVVLTADAGIEPFLANKVTYTVEVNVYMTDINDYQTFWAINNNTDMVALYTYDQGADPGRLLLYRQNGVSVITVDDRILVNTCYQIRVVSNALNTTIYVNGVQWGQGSGPAPIGSASVVVLVGNDGGDVLDGYYSSFKITTP